MQWLLHSLWTRTCYHTPFTLLTGRILITFAALSNRGWYHVTHSCEAWYIPYGDAYHHCHRNANSLLTPQFTNKLISWLSVTESARLCWDFVLFLEPLSTIGSIGLSMTRILFSGDATDIRYECLVNCNLKMVGREFSRKPYALAVQKGSQLKGILNNA